MAYILTQLLGESAERNPEGIAVWARGRTIAYGELEQRSNQLAWALRDRKVKKGDRIGLCFPKSVESITSMLGILKAGGVYVPLDYQQPASRARYIINSCGIKALIIDRERLRALAPSEIKSVEFSVLAEPSVTTDLPQTVAWDELGSFPTSAPPELQGVTTDLAYILYTSGSTGRPKGVMLSHQNALTFIEWCAETFQIRPEDHLSSHAPLHFDLSVFDIYNTIKAAATVYMIPEDMRLFPSSLVEFMETQRLTVWYSVPSALVQLVLHGNLPAHNLNHLRLILFAGEVFPMKYLRQLAKQLSWVELYNLYGPTETNVCTYYRVDRSRLGSMDRLPIGKACANTEVFAVDEHGQMVTQPGQEGELYARGPSVTNGYWGDLTATKQAVVPNPFETHFEEKAYRTGDLVKLLEDGNYDFIGRRDSQIKSRGYRIDLGEIEATLLGHPDVREAAGVAIPDAEIGTRIKAFVTLQHGSPLTPLDLRRYCASRIPTYMVPEAIEFCDVLPTTSTGKVDRVRLTGRLE